MSYITNENVLIKRTNATTGVVPDKRLLDVLIDCVVNNNISISLTSSYTLFLLSIMERDWARTQSGSFKMGRSLDDSQWKTFPPLSGGFLPS